MVPTKPYLLRAIYEWCVDQGLTPHLSIQVDSRARVPREYVRDGQIVLNIGPEATHRMMLGNDEITFQARFNGAAFPVVVPVDTVTAIFARENGQGLSFEVGETPATDPNETVSKPDEADAVQPPAAPPPSRSHLTRVK